MKRKKGWNRDNALFILESQFKLNVFFFFLLDKKNLWKNSNKGELAPSDIKMYCEIAAIETLCTREGIDVN